MILKIIVNLLNAALWLIIKRVSYIESKDADAVYEDATLLREHGQLVYLYEKLQEIANGHNETNSTTGR